MCEEAVYSVGRLFRGFRKLSRRCGKVVSGLWCGCLEGGEVVW